LTRGLGHAGIPQELPVVLHTASVEDRSRIM